MSSHEEIATKFADHTRNVTYLRGEYYPSNGLSETLNICRFQVASLALWVFENLITMNLELTYIWKSHWNMMKGLYIFVRYITYVDLITNLIAVCVPALSAASCKSIFYAIILFLVIGITASDLVLNITFLTPVWISGGFLANSFETNLQNAHLVREGCIASADIRFATAAWGVMLAYQLVMLLLMFPPAYRAFTTGDKSTIMEVVIRDGKFVPSSSSNYDKINQLLQELFITFFYS
ncbi:hypothetical protein BDQ17DRAFT_1328153 [Cyathus striatus]|nr:hypothetical protein BDQ17DRAFT_1328153 [Cyathus striatus]